jgi:UDP-N-acetylmuramyl pentapeptide synthase
MSIKTFGSKEESDARLVSYVYDVKSYSWDVESNIEGKSVKYRVPILGDHAPLMSTLALLTVSHLGYDVKKSSKCYSSFKSSQTMGRLYEIEMGSGAFQFLDHSYRISIPSAKSAIKSLSYFHHKDRGRKIAVLTEIYEMSEKYCKWSYSKIGKMINNSGIDIIYIYGKEFFSIVKENIDSNIKIKEFKDDSIEEVLDEINVGDIVMVQGQPHVKCSMSLVREIYKKGQVKNIIGNSHLIPQKSR